MDQDKIGADEVNIFREDGQEDDGTAEIIRNALDALDADEEDDGGLDQPLDASPPKEPDVVSQEDGLDLLDKAEMAKARNKEKTEEKDTKAEEPKEPEAESKDEPTSDEEAKEDNPIEEKPKDLRSAGLNTLLEGLPEDRQGEISRRIAASEKILAPFKAHEAELKQHGQTPESAISRLLELNRFAKAKPDEYLAWVAQQASDTPEQLLEHAAKHLGLKLVKEASSDDEDMFSDPETRALKEENDRLKAKLAGEIPEFGPDTRERQQQRQTQQQLTDFIGEVDEAGQLKRPFFQQLQPRITQMAQAHVQASGKSVTTEDLQRFYEQSVEEMRNAFGV